MLRESEREISREILKIPRLGSSNCHALGKENGRKKNEQNKRLADGPTVQNEAAWSCRVEQGGRGGFLDTGGVSAPDWGARGQTGRGQSVFMTTARRGHLATPLTLSLSTLDALPGPHSQQPSMCFTLPVTGVSRQVIHWLLPGGRILPCACDRGRRRKEKVAEVSWWS